ncbi:hypothetical protein Poli38472_005310 [Pythium oligandrum]|uniref:Serine protease n=1 Tax=Pythium oligandrum TaxID=41045 RepID=A0A8K1CG34_PYTOL|nr:hypothetical protein Poli38472_005310 [Pythium oligandrum]|eukprot:TMW62692.1 hypothetical protein Poli38472_005310 [Pythium oligandrum]
MVFGSFKKLAVLAALAVAGATAQNAPYYNEHGILQVGAVEALNITAPLGVNRVDYVSNPMASYISVKFDNFDLPTGDVVIVRNPDSTEGHIYVGKGRGDLGAFASSPISGTTAIVEYYSTGATTPSSHSAYQIAGYVRGFQSQMESVCGAADQTKPAKCFTGTPYTKAQAVARLLIGGSSLCTGWLIGSQGHVMTNQHCVESAADAAQIDIEFGAESASCSTLCATSLGCKGTIAARSAKFIANSASIDYAVVQIASSAASTYGYLQFRASGPVKGEKIYIPQHPAGWAKRIVNTVDGGAAATITATGASNTGCGNNQVKYMADTQGGSSGSPVLSQTDNLVVALHHCGGCDNLAVDPRDVIKDLSAKGITIANISK